MAFALKSKFQGKTQGAEKPAPNRKSARGQSSADLRSRFETPVFQPLTAAPPIAPVIQAKPKIGEPARAGQSGMLQRKCSCGGATGMSGECDKCGKNQRFGLQTKLTVNEPGDVYEQEADRIADKVMAAPAEHDVSRAPLRIQRFSGQSSGQMDAAPVSVNHALSGPGSPLEPALRQDMEQRFGYDFSKVRVHSGAAAEQSAQEVNANAYTLGHDIVFGAGRFSPGSLEGQRLLAHELTHVVQQAGHNMPFVQRQEKEDGHTWVVVKQITVESMVTGPGRGRALTSDGKTLPIDIEVNNLPAGNYDMEKPQGSFGWDDWSRIHMGAKSANRFVYLLPPGVTLAPEVTIVVMPKSRTVKQVWQEIQALPKHIQEFVTNKYSRAATVEDYERALRIGKKLQSANISPEEMYQYTKGPDKSLIYSDESIDLFIAERQAQSQQELQTTQTLESKLASTRQLTETKGLDESMVDIYRDYQQFKKLSVMRSQNVVTGSARAFEFARSYPEAMKQIITQGQDAYYARLQDSIEKKLAAYGIAGIKEFESRVAAFELIFRDLTVKLGLRFLERANRICQRFLIERKEVEATLRWNEKAKVIIRTLDPVRQPLVTDITLAQKRAQEAKGRAITSFSEKHLAEAKEAQKAAQTTQGAALDLVAKALPQFPFIAWPDFPGEKLLRERDPARMMYWVGWYLNEHSKGIEKAIGQLNTNSARIYKLDLLLALAKQKFSIADGSILDLIISDKVKEASEESFLEDLKNVLMFALMIVSIVVPGGVGMAATVGASVLSASQSFDMLKQYYEDLAAHKANLSSSDPSQFWVIVAIVGVGLDAKGAIDLLASSAALRKAMQGFRDTRDLTRLSEDLALVSELTPEARVAIREEAEKQLAKETHLGETAGSEVTGQTHIGARAEAAAKPVDDISRLPAASAKDREASVAISSHNDNPTRQELRNEIDEVKAHPERMEGVEPHRSENLGDHTWEERGDGVWCRHSDGEYCVFVGQTGTAPKTSTATKATHPEESLISKYNRLRNEYEDVITVSDRLDRQLQEIKEALLKGETDKAKHLAIEFEKDAKFLKGSERPGSHQVLDPAEVNDVRSRPDLLNITEYDPTIGDSARLGENMAKADRPRPRFADPAERYQAHHIIPSNEAPEELRNLLRRHELDINGEFNGVWLATGAKATNLTAAIKHEFLTGSQHYFARLRAILIKVPPLEKAQVIEKLRKIAGYLEEGKLPPGKL